MLHPFTRSNKRRPKLQWWIGFAVGVILLELVVSNEAQAGGGPMEVLVLFNAADPKAEEVATYYLSARSIPTEHGCAVTGVVPSEPVITFGAYLETIRPAIDDCLAALPYPEEINYVVLVRGLPYRVDLPDGGYSTSLSAMIQVHHATDRDDVELAGSPQAYDDVFHASVLNPVYVEGSAGVGDYTVSNPAAEWYESSPQVVEENEQPLAFSKGQLLDHAGYLWRNNLFIVSRLDGFDYQDAHDLVDRAIEAESMVPEGDLLCMAGADEARGARDPECEFATRHLEMAGLPGAWLETHDSDLSGRELGAYFTGAANLKDAIDGNTYSPGALVDNLTSFGAVPGNFYCDKDTGACPASESQTSIARFIRAGATGAHGSVAEPLNNCFPNASALLFYTFGYSAGESWLFSQRYLYWQDIYLGDPLVTPYGERPQVEILWWNEDEQPLDRPVEVLASHSAGIALLRLFHNGVLVKETQGEELSWQPEGEVDETLHLLAVAIAQDEEVERAGWPAPLQTPRPATQGWTSRETRLVETEEDGDDSEGNDGGDAACGCSSLQTLIPGGTWFCIGAAVFWRRRAVTGARTSQSNRNKKGN